jgi:hypothetical protein
MDEARSGKGIYTTQKMSRSLTKNNLLVFYRYKINGNSEAYILNYITA